MARPKATNIAAAVSQSLERFGADIRTARIRRSLTVEMLASVLGIHRTTITRMEAGSPAVSLGNYANALYSLGLGTPFTILASPATDEIGLRLDLERLPKRVCRPATHYALRPPESECNVPMMAGSGFDGVFKVGVVGAMSGPYALWGLVSKAAAETTAALHNDRGGLRVGGKHYMIEILAEDDRLSPDASYAAVGSLIEKGVRYIIGPNVEQTVRRVLPLVEAHGVMLFPYAMSRTLYSPPIANAVLSQVAGFQAWPWIFRYMKEQRHVHSVAVLSPDTPEALNQRHEAAAAARQVGLRVISVKKGYCPGTTDHETQITSILHQEPDLIVLPNLAPGDASGLIHAARSIGFRGHFATEAAQDVQALYDEAGEAADGMVMLGGALSRGSGSRYLGEYVERYTEIAGAWNDEGGTKAYALEFILATLSRIGSGALTDVDLFKTAIPEFSVRDPFLLGQEALRYTGWKFFHQPRQLRIPLSIKVAEQGDFRSLVSSQL